jgi:hypothetical protein
VICSPDGAITAASLRPAVSRMRLLEGVRGQARVITSYVP